MLSFLGSIYLCQLDITIRAPPFRHRISYKSLCCYRYPLYLFAVTLLLVSANSMLDELIKIAKLAKVAGFAIGYQRRPPRGSYCTKEATSLRL